jgi:hypothetical protein
VTEHGLPGRPFKLVDEARRILGAVKEEPKPMPEIGGSSFATSLKEIIGGLRREMDEIKGETAKAVEDFREQVSAAREVPKRIRAETQVLRDGINELLGNQPPSGS